MALPYSLRKSGPHTLSAGQTGPIPFDWVLFNNADALVQRLRAGVLSILSIGVDYSVSGVGSPGGGSITLLAGAEEDDQILIIGARAITRSSNLVTERSTLPEQLNRDLDICYAQLQEMARVVADVLTKSLFTGQFDAQGLKLTNLAEGSSEGDAINFGQVQQLLGQAANIGLLEQIDTVAPEDFFIVFDDTVQASRKASQAQLLAPAVKTSQIGSVVQAFSSILQATTASFLTAHKDKLDYLTLTGAVNLDTLAAQALRTGDIGSLVQAYSAVLQATTASFLTAHKTKLDYLTVTGARDLDELAGDLQALITSLGQSNGVATLDAGGKIPASQIPALAIGEVFVVASEAAMLALSGADRGDIAVRADVSKNFVLSVDGGASTLANWVELQGGGGGGGGAVSSVAGLTGAIAASALKTALGITVADITDMSNNGRSLVAMSYAAMKSALAIAVADITDMSANGRSLVAMNYAAMKSALAIVAGDVSGLAAIATSGSASDLSGTLATARMGANHIAGAAIFVIDGGGVAITTGVKGEIVVPYSGTITRWTLLADQAGSIVLDIWKDTYANAPPLVADSITAAAKPTLSAAAKAQSSTLTSWITAVNAGDILRFNVDSAATVQRCTIVIDITKS